VVVLDRDGRPISLGGEAGPPKSHYAVTGLYFYDNRVVSTAPLAQPVGTRVSWRSRT